MRMSQGPEAHASRGRSPSPAPRASKGKSQNPGAHASRGKSQSPGAHASRRTSQGPEVRAGRGSDELACATSRNDTNTYSVFCLKNRVRGRDLREQNKAVSGPNTCPKQRCRDVRAPQRRRRGARRTRGGGCSGRAWRVVVVLGKVGDVRGFWLELHATEARFYTPARAIIGPPISISTRDGLG
jgi:hypothetical protein